MSNHDDGDWDSELGEGLVDILGDGGFGCWATFIILLIALALLSWHLWG